jgi:hypothetical protein
MTPNTPIPSDPSEEDIELQQRMRLPKEITLKILKKEGHCIMQLITDPGPTGMIWTQSAGNEMKYALRRAKKVWKLPACRLVSATDTEETWRINIKDL